LCINYVIMSNKYHTELILIWSNPNPNCDLGRPDFELGQVAIWVRTLILNKVFSVLRRITNNV